MHIRSLFGLVLLLSLTAPAGATKPCPEHPCYVQNTFDQKTCERLAPWIFTGRIVKVVDHPTGEPTFKNFAEFTVEIDRWEKGQPSDAPKQMVFRVGWCRNGRVLPDDAKERAKPMRFYGGGSPNASEPEYLWFEPLSAK